MSQKQFTILVVCTGNSCRSPMAEGLLKERLRKHGINNVFVHSAGTHAPVGNPPTMNTQIVTFEAGIRIHDNRAVQITKEMILQADLILVMEKVHKKIIVEMAPEAENKTYLFRQLINDSDEAEIADPIGKKLNEYRICFSEIRESLDLGFPVLIDKIKKGS